MSRIKGIIDAVSDLAMDYQSRMARAKEQGFDTDTPYYHGSDDNIDAFDINKVGQNTITNTFPNGFWFSPEKKIAKGYGSNIHEVYLNKGVSNPGSLAGKDLFEAGVGDSVEYPRAIVLRDPSRIRSVDAAFDPAKKDSSNLLAGVTGAGLLGGSMVASEDADAGILSRIKAFHGSPHDFDRFSSENIGTGEGAQAYGHGLYFAEREGTAKSYKNELSASVDYDGKPILRRNKQVGSTGDADLDDSLIAELGDVDKSIKFWENDLQSDSDDLRDYAAIQIEKLKNAKSKVKTTGGGHMYEVNIDASPDDLLDWDKPLSQQSPKIKKIFPPENYPESFDGRAMYMQIAGSASIGKNRAKVVGGTTESAAATSAKLNDLGIKGIKYADAQTRFSPKGRTNNYVMFDDKTIEIARKYGVSMPVAGAILAGTVTPQDAQASNQPASRGLMDSFGDTALETMSGVNRAMADGVNFLTSDQINAILNLSGSDKRIPDLYDLPGVESGTKGNYMEPGLLRQIVRQGSEFLSPI